MGYGFYLEDIDTFDDLIAWLESHINDTLALLDEFYPRNELRFVLKEIVKAKHTKEITKYGWTGDEVLPDVVAVNLFHEVFVSFSTGLYVDWIKENFDTLEIEEGIYNQQSTAKAAETLQKRYKDENVPLTDELMVQEMKRGLHMLLTKIHMSLEYTLENEADILSVTEKGKIDVSQVATELMDMMDQAFEIEKQVNEIAKRAERLNYGLNGYGTVNVEKED